MSTSLALTRRQVLAGSITGAAALVGAPVASAIAPIKRPGAAKFKFSLAAYSYRSLLTSGELALSDFVADCAAMQLEGTELTSYYFPPKPTREFLCDLKSQCFRLGLDVSGTAVGNDFGLPDGVKREAQIANVKQWIEYAAVLGAPVIRIFAGHAPKGADPQQTHARMVAGIEESCDYAGQHGVFLALENHGGPTATADGLLEFARDVQSPWFGVNLDSGNFRSERVYDDLARVAPYALNVQVKVVTAGPGGVRRPTDYQRLAAVLRDVGYRGYIVLEYEEQGDPRVECPLHVDRIREAFA